MGTAERRYEIMKVLCRRRYATIRDLASEFGVSMRTVQRDIEALSRSEPIYTRFGKYGGGVFCRLYDGVTDVLCSYGAMQYDGDFKIGDSVEIVVNRYNAEKKLVYGKILRRMRRG